MDYINELEQDAREIADGGEDEQTPTDQQPLITGNPDLQQFLDKINSKCNVSR